MTPDEFRRVLEQAISEATPELASIVEQGILGRIEEGKTITGETMVIKDSTRRAKANKGLDERPWHGTGELIRSLTVEAENRGIRVRLGADYASYVEKLLPVIGVDEADAQKLGAAIARRVENADG